MTRSRTLAILFGLAVATGVITPTPAFAAANVTIHGTVTSPSGGVPDAPVWMLVCGNNSTGSGCGYGTQTYDQATGAYTITVQPGTYSIGFNYTGTSTILPFVALGGAFELSNAASTTYAAAQDVTADVRLVAAATISGTVSGGGQPVTSGTVTIERDGDFYGRYTAYIGSDGSYLAKGLPPGTYTLLFDSGSTWNYGYWQNARNLTTATHVSVAEGASVVLGDDSLTHSTAVIGTVQLDSGGVLTPLPNDYVSLTPVPYNEYETKLVFTDAQGHYEIDGIAPGTYTLCFGSDQYVVPSCWNNEDRDHPTQISIAAGDVLTGMDGTVRPAGRITATVQTRDGTGAPAVPLAGADVDLWKLNDAGTFYDFFREQTTDTGGNVSAEQLPVGTYRIEFRDPSGDHSSEWWNNHRYFGDSEDLVVGTNSTTDLGDVVLLPRTLDPFRTSGEDRFSGAVQMTQAIWPLPTAEFPDGEVPLGGVPIIYIANGLNYPDALSAGPAAIVQQGALLLVLPTSIPDVVAAELHRLHPKKIVIVGGPASVSDDVMNQLSAFVSDPGDVTRQNGIDRFAASRNLARSVWGGPTGPGAQTVFISTGLNFPDALDAGPAAGLVNGPVILVNGSLPALDTDTVDLLGELETINVFIAGGPGSVSPGIEAQLTNKLGADHVHRFTGETRYEAAAAINAWFFPTAETVFLATGANFPDALAGAPLAGAVGGPIYLSQPTCIPQIVASQISEGDTQGIWLLGGPASITPAVEDRTVCAS
ncbi:MAG: cell wall-binding repeat-containing protein [Pseudolysinimonas sp.]